MGHKTIRKTNHYILLTNVSIKRCIKTSFETGFIRGGRVPTRQVPYRQNLIYIQVVYFYRGVVKFNLQPIIQFCYEFLVCCNLQKIFCIIVLSLKLQYQQFMLVSRGSLGLIMLIKNWNKRKFNVSADNLGQPL